MKILAGILIAVGIFFGLMVILAAVPSLLARVLDPINIKHIKTFCTEAGCTDIEVKAWPNHYGVTFRKNGTRHYVKCNVVGRTIKWKDLDPGEVQ